jgi:dipeptidyl aminopeptidase/acylaminoacyl peptidase
VINSDSSNVYLRGVIEKKRISTLFELSVVSGQITQFFTGLEADLSHWITNTNSSKPVVGVTYPDKAKYHYAGSDIRIASIHKALVKAFNGQSVYLTSRTRDGTLLVIHVASDVNPVECYVYNAKSRKADLPLINSSWIDPQQMRQKKTIEFTARDGLDIADTLLFRL